ncbi:hypothetical protein N9Z96_00740 [bacterium]|nr:hypothetical protein [bacterium]
MSAYAKTPNDIHYIFYDDFEKISHGGFSLSHGQLNFLTDEQNINKTTKLMQIYIRPEARGEGLFRSIMETLKMFAEENGVLLHFVAHHFKIDMPIIRRPEEYGEWLSNEDVNLKMEKDNEKEWHLSKKLYNSYQRMGFCNLTLDREDVSKEKWRHMAFCSAPTAAAEDIQEAIADRTNCDENRMSHKEQMAHRNIGRKKQRKRLKDAIRRNSSCKPA